MVPLVKAQPWPFRPSQVNKPLVDRKHWLSELGWNLQLLSSLQYYSQLKVSTLSPKPCDSNSEVCIVASVRIEGNPRSRWNKPIRCLRS